MESRVDKRSDVTRSNTPSATATEHAMRTNRRACLVPFQRIARAFSALSVLLVEQKLVGILYAWSHDSTMALLEASAAQERVDAAHHNVYNMQNMGRAWLGLVVCCDRSSDTPGCYR